MIDVRSHSDRQVLRTDMGHALQRSPDLHFAPGPPTVPKYQVLLEVLPRSVTITSQIWKSKDIVDNLGTLTRNNAGTFSTRDRE